MWGWPKVIIKATGCYNKRMYCVRSIPVTQQEYEIGPGTWYVVRPYLTLRGTTLCIRKVKYAICGASLNYYVPYRTLKYAVTSFRLKVRCVVEEKGTPSVAQP